VDLIKFLLPAHITGLAISMLLFAAENVAVIAFAAASAIASKYLFRVIVGVDEGGRPTFRHVLNPSNFGISATLLLFPTVGIAPPYQFTENTSGIVDWILPLIIICTGSYLNIKATGRIPLIIAWASAFAAAFYMLFMELHIVFGMFYALTLVTAARGVLISLSRRYQQPTSGPLAIAPTAGMTPAK
jgi:hypothetical protein